MDREQIESLRKRYEAGERITRLARETDLSWQKLWALLDASRADQSPQPPQPRSQTPPRPMQRPRRPVEAPQPQEPRQSDKGECRPAVRDIDGAYRISFQDLGEVIGYAMTDAAQNATNLRKVRAHLAEGLSGHSRFGNSYTREKLLASVKQPPAALMNAVDEMRQQLMDAVAPPVCARRRVRRNQEWGDELTPESVLARNLTPWERMERESQPRRSVTIGVNLAVASIRKPEELLWRGATAAALADILSQKGVNVEIIAFWCNIKTTSTCKDKVVAKTVVKHADMPLDLAAVAFSLSEIAYARMVMVTVLGQCLKGVLASNWGYPATLPDADRQGIDYLAEGDILTREAAEAWLRQSASRQESEVLHV